MNLLYKNVPLTTEEVRKKNEDVKAATNAISLESKVSNLLFFKKNEHRLESKYEQRRRQDISVPSVFLLNVFVSVYLLGLCTTILRLQPTLYGYLILAFASVFSVINGFAIAMVLNCKRYLTHLSHQKLEFPSFSLRRLIKHLPIMENIYCISTCIGFCSILVIIANGFSDCIDSKNINFIGLLCNTDNELVQPTLAAAVT